MLVTPKGAILGLGHGAERERCRQGRYFRLSTVVGTQLGAGYSCNDSGGGLPCEECRAPLTGARRMCGSCYDKGTLFPDDHMFDVPRAGRERREQKGKDTRETVGVLQQVRPLRCRYGGCVRGEIFTVSRRPRQVPPSDLPTPSVRRRRAHSGSARGRTSEDI